MTVSSQTGPFMEGKVRTKKEAKHSRSVGRKYNKQGNLYRIFVLSSRKTSTSLHLPSRILKDALMGFSLLYHTDGSNDTLLSQEWVLENSSGCGNGETCPPLITSSITSVKWMNLRNKKILEKFTQCRIIPLIKANKHAKLSRDMNIFGKSVKKKIW